MTVPTQRAQKSRPRGRHRPHPVDPPLLRARRATRHRLLLRPVHRRRHVEDEGTEYRRIEAIRVWRANIPLVTYTVHAIHTGNAGSDATVDIAGNFPGSPVRLTFHFEFDAGERITKLTIRP